MHKSARRSTTSWQVTGLSSKHRYWCSELTLPYLVTEDTNSRPHKTLRQPWQNVGSSCECLGNKLMLALLPQTTFLNYKYETTSLVA